MHERIPPASAASALSEQTAAAGLRPLATAAPPQPAPEAPPIIAPRDTAYPGRLTLSVDATDTTRGILRARQSIPVDGPGPLTLLYPKWMPGYHSPQNPIELFAGLEIKAGTDVIDWVRDPVEVYGFHIEVPAGTEALDLSFQFLTPTAPTQGDVVVTPDMLNLQWGRILLYPAGYFARGIEVEASVTLPEGWSPVTVLEAARSAGATTTFKPVPLDVLVDSPLMAGGLTRELPLDPSVGMTLFAHHPEHLAATLDQAALHGAVVTQADSLFKARHFDRYKFLIALTEELGGGGVEHHRSAEIIVPPDYFTQWERNLTKRDVFAHEFVHSWNGKFRRGADSWTPSFERPIRNSLMWVYEGQTQYWGHVLTARAGLWSKDMALEALAKTAATYDTRPGGTWRTMADTTRDPIITGREPVPWLSWQRSEDYYSEGQLLWFDVDTLIRELSNETRSLDDFAQAFFGMDAGSTVTRTYDFDEVVRTLNGVAGYDWAGLLQTALESRKVGAPMDGLARGGYRLVYRDYQSEFCKSFDAVAGQFDLRFSIGLTISHSGAVQEVMWGSAAFDAGVTAGSTLETVNGSKYSQQAIGDAIEVAREGQRMTLAVNTRGRSREVNLDYQDGHRFPHLEPIDGARRRLDEIFTAR